jgi:hypothetical protein
VDRRDEARAEVPGVLLAQAAARGIAGERVPAPDLPRIMRQPGKRQPGKRQPTQGATR